MRITDIQCVPLATEPGISLIILPIMRILLLRVATIRRTADTHYRHTLHTHNTNTHYRHTLQTHSSSFLTQRTYCFSNFVAISSLPSSVSSGTSYIFLLSTAPKFGAWELITETGHEENLAPSSWLQLNISVYHIATICNCLLKQSNCLAMLQLQHKRSA